MDTAQQAREIADAIMDIFQPGSRKTEHYRRMRSAVLETLMPALAAYGDARAAEMRERAALVVEAAGTPYTFHVATGAMMFRTATEKIAAAIRALADTQEKSNG
jgi:hypothetical protein